MGDGQHMWAACEWAMMVRNCFVREERGRLIIGSGVRPEWCRAMGASFGPTLTPFGPVSVRLVPTAESSSPFAGARRDERRNNTLVTDTLRVVVEATWREVKPELELRVPGFDPVVRMASGAREEFNLSDQP
jgi:hypothetical protein